MVLRITFFAVFALIAMDSHAQFWKKKQAPKNDPSTQQPTSLSPSTTPQRHYTPKAPRPSKGPTYGLEQEYYERVEAVAKERRKAEKIMMKPQYSDPMYFGHKRPPKKRKPSKMKYCQECGIRH